MSDVIWLDPISIVQDPNIDWSALRISSPSIVLLNDNFEYFLYSNTETVELEEDNSLFYPIIADSQVNLIDKSNSSYYYLDFKDNKSLYIEEPFKAQTVLDKTFPYLGDWYLFYSKIFSNKVDMQSFLFKMNLLNKDGLTLILEQDSPYYSHFVPNYNFNFINFIYNYGIKPYISSLVDMLFWK